MLCYKFATDRGMQLVSYNQDGFILERRPGWEACLEALNENLAPFGHELRVKAFTYDESQLAPEGSVPTDTDLIELMRDVSVVSHTQKCSFPRAEYWAKRAHFLSTRFFNRSNASW